MDTIRRNCQIEWHHDDEQELITVSSVKQYTFEAVFCYESLSIHMTLVCNTNVGTDAKASGFHDSERFSNLMSKLFYGMRCISWYAGRTESEE